jgi:Protein of unknown function (DUF3592)
VTIRRSGSGQLPVWFGIPFLLGGLFAAAMGVVLFQDEQRFGREGVSVQGTVVDAVYHSGGEDGPSYSIRYEFVDPVTGVRHAGESDVDEAAYESASVGAPIEVTYIPAEPTKSRIGSPEPQLVIPFVVLGVGALFSVVGIGLVLLTVRMRRHGTPSWLHVTTGAAEEPEESGDRSMPDFMANFTSSDAAAPDPTPDKPLTETELRALDARLAPDADEPRQGPPST